MRAGGTKRAGDVTVKTFEKKLTKLFTRSIPTTFITMTMLENEVGAWYQRHYDATFVDFGSDRRSDSYVI